MDGGIPGPLRIPAPPLCSPVLALRAILAAATWPAPATSGQRPCPAGAAPHLALLRNPAGLAARLIRLVVLGWLLAVAAFAVLLSSMPSLHQGRRRQHRGAKSSRPAPRPGSLVELYLGLTLLLLALILGLVAAGHVTAIRAEEPEGRLEDLVVRPLRQASWFAGRLGLTALLIVLAALRAGGAALLPEAIAAVCVFASVGPYGMPGLDFADRLGGDEFRDQIRAAVRPRPLDRAAQLDPLRSSPAAADPREHTAGLPAPETMRRLKRAILEYQHGRLRDDAATVLVEWQPGRPDRSLTP